MRFLSGVFTCVFSLAAAANTKLESNFFEVQLIKGQLNMPWSMKVTPDGQSLLFTSRDNGEISQLNLKTNELTKIATVANVRFTWQAGLLGMDLDKDFNKNRQVYVCYSTGTKEAPENRVSKFTLPEKSGGGLKEQILIDHIEGHSGYHNGCQVVRGLDNLLYISTGDAAVDAFAPDLSKLAGKVLRIQTDGKIPKDNPFPQSPVYSYGHRNPLGLAVDPLTGDIWETEHGPNTQDELNKILKGRNYGWPACKGVSDCGNKDFEPAQAEFTTDGTVAISELMFYSGKKNPKWKNNIFFVTLKTARLYRVEIKNGQAVNSEIMLDWLANAERLRDVTESPEGDLIISTENYPNPNSKILRLIPK